MNYMPPEAIKDMSSSRENGKSKSKVNEGCLHPSYLASAGNEPDISGSYFFNF